MDVVRQVRYDSAFTFLYSKRTGTPAAAMEDQIPKEVAQPRFDRLLALVQEISKEVCSSHSKKKVFHYGHFLMEKNWHYIRRIFVNFKWLSLQSEVELRF